MIERKTTGDPQIYVEKSDVAKFKATSGLENPEAESYIFDLSAIHYRYSTDAPFKIRNL